MIKRSLQYRNFYLPTTYIAIVYYFNARDFYRSLSITDRVVKMMEKYSEDLENKVAMKTHQLRSQQAGKSLSKYLPRFGHLMNRVVVAVPV